MVSPSIFSTTIEFNSNLIPVDFSFPSPEMETCLHKRASVGSDIEITCNGPLTVPTISSSTTHNPYGLSHFMNAVPFPAGEDSFQCTADRTGHSCCHRFSMSNNMVTYNAATPGLYPVNFSVMLGIILLPFNGLVIEPDQRHAY